MKIPKGLDRQTFQSKFGTKEACYRHLAEIKWAEGYLCKQCGHNDYIRGKQPFSRKCRKCCYDESTTSGTLFHKLKFGIDKAFEMLYEITMSKKGASSIWLAERFGIQQKTAWLFRHKVQKAMKSSGKHPLDGHVHVDEFEIGGPEEGEPGRSASEKKMRVVIAVEERDGKAGRAYGKVINDFSTESLKPIFGTHIDTQAIVVTDNWSGYKPIRSNYPYMNQINSEKGQNFSMIHLQIRNFKNWLRGIHSSCKKEHLQSYLDEYCYRFNRRNHRNTILEKIINRCIHHKPLPHLNLISAET
jgi:transposase-like protein